LADLGYAVEIKPLVLHRHRGALAIVQAWPSRET
jgi:hypothetical protein